MKSNTKIAVLLAMLGILLVSGQANAAIVAGSTTGVFTDVLGATVPVVGEGTNSLAWDSNTVTFVGDSFGPVETPADVGIGTFSAFNGASVPGTDPDSFVLDVEFTFTSPAGVVENVEIPIEYTATRNLDGNTPEENADLFELILPAGASFSVDTTQYHIQILGFSGFSGGAVEELSNATTLAVYEGTEGSAILQARISASVVPEPASVIAWSLLGAAFLGMTYWRRRSGR